MDNLYYFEKAYLALGQGILDHGIRRMDRTGTGTSSVFAGKLDVKLDVNYIPLLLSKKIHYKSVIHELLWFISGSTNIQYLKDNGVSIWDEWADEKGELGKVYGYQWRKGSDQLKTVIDNIKSNPYSRRHIVNAWNVDDLADMALPPCHYSFQFVCWEDGNDKKIASIVNMRSADWFLGVPFNIASYALLTKMVGQLTGREADRVVFNFGDAHLYDNHRDQMATQIRRFAKVDRLPTPKLHLIPNCNIDSYTFDDFQISDYQPLPAIPAPISK